MTIYKDICNARRSGLYKLSEFTKMHEEAIDKINKYLRDYMSIPPVNGMLYVEVKDNKVVNEKERSIGPIIHFNKNENMYECGVLINIPDGENLTSENMFHIIREAEFHLIPGAELFIHVKFRFIKEGQWQIKFEHACEETIDINNIKEMEKLLHKLTVKIKEALDFNPDSLSKDKKQNFGFII